MGRMRVYFLCAVWLAAWLLVGVGTLRGETKSERMRRKRDPLGLYLGRDSPSGSAWLKPHDLAPTKIISSCWACRWTESLRRRIAA